MTAEADEPDVSTPAGRGRLGPREGAVMAVLWEQPKVFLTVREVSQRLNAELAYTTVMTLLSRLHAKGHLERHRVGRAWAFRPFLSRGEHAAAQMTAALQDTEDHADALLHFVEHLAPEDQQALLRRLSEGDQQ